MLDGACVTLPPVAVMLVAPPEVEDPCIAMFPIAERVMDPVKAVAAVTVSDELLCTLIPFGAIALSVRVPGACEVPGVVTCRGALGEPIEPFVAVRMRVPAEMVELFVFEMFEYALRSTTPGAEMLL